MFVKRYLKTGNCSLPTPTFTPTFAAPWMGAVCIRIICTLVYFHVPSHTATTSRGRGGIFFVWCWQSVQECGTREDGRRQTGEKHLVVKYGHKGRCQQITEGGVPEANTKAFKNSHCAHEGRTGKLRGAFDFICQPFLLECFFLKVGVTRITKERTPGFVPTLE